MTPSRGFSAHGHIFIIGHPCTISYNQNIWLLAYDMINAAIIDRLQHGTGRYECQLDYVTCLITIRIQDFTVNTP